MSLLKEGRIYRVLKKDNTKGKALIMKVNEERTLAVFLEPKKDRGKILITNRIGDGYKMSSQTVSEEEIAAALL